MNRPRSERRSIDRRGAPGAARRGAPGADPRGLSGADRRGGASGASPVSSQRKQRLRAEYVSAARRVLAREGLDGLSIARVAAEVGLTKTSLYYYFDSKQSLLVAVAAEILCEEADQLERQLSEERGRGALFALLRALVLHYVERPQDFRAAYLYPAALGASARLLETPSFPKIVAVNERVVRALRGSTLERPARERSLPHWRSEPSVDASVEDEAQRGALRKGDASGKGDAVLRVEVSAAQSVEAVRALAHGIVLAALDRPRPRLTAIDALRAARRWLEARPGSPRV